MVMELAPLAVGQKWEALSARTMLDLVYIIRFAGSEDVDWSFWFSAWIWIG
jgi:hypothetical protein